MPFTNVRYTPQNAEDVQAKQRYAQKMGIDLKALQEFALNPAAFQEQNSQYFDPSTNRYNIPGVTPGALMGANNLANPNLGVVAAGSTPGNVNFLPPYLQPGATAGTPSAKSAVPTVTGAPTGNAVAPPITTPTPAPGSPIAPMKPPGSSGFTGGFTPNAPGTASAGGSFASTAKLLELPYYLRQQYGR